MDILLNSIWPLQIGRQIYKIQHSRYNWHILPIFIILCSNCMFWCIFCSFLLIGTFLLVMFGSVQTHSVLQPHFIICWQLSAIGVCCPIYLPFIVFLFRIRIGIVYRWHVRMTSPSPSPSVDSISIQQTLSKYGLAQDASYAAHLVCWTRIIWVEGIASNDLRFPAARLNLS